MLNRIYIRSKGFVTSKTIIDSPDAAIISILDSDAEPLTNRGKLHTSFFFDDIAPSQIEQNYPDRIAMSVKDAKDIIAFTELVKNARREFELYIHCSAGVCRSGAVGLFLTRYLGLDEEKFYKRNPQIIPNRWVMDVLCYAKQELEREL